MLLLLQELSPRYLLTQLDIQSATSKPNESEACTHGMPLCEDPQLCFYSTCAHDEDERRNHKGERRETILYSRGLLKNNGMEFVRPPGAGLNSQRTPVSAPHFEDSGDRVQLFRPDYQMLYIFMLRRFCFETTHRLWFE
jgi:hypothetical protein